MKKTLSLLLLVVLAWPLSMFGVLSNDVRNLKGNDGFRVVVKGFDHAGLNDEKVTLAIELRLRSLGIRVDNRRFPYLNVKATFQGINSTDLVAFSINSDFVTEVLVPSSNVYVFAPVWEDTVLGVTGKSFTITLNGLVDEFVDEFANDYLAANPPEPRSGQGDE